MRRARIERAAALISAARSHGALELLGARCRVAFGEDPRRAGLDHLVDTQHRLLTRCEALADEVARCADEEEVTW